MASMVITGAAGGIGRALIDRLAQQQISLLLVDRDQGALDTLVNAIPSPRADIATRVSQLDTPEACRDVIKAAGPKLDGLVHLAGVFETDPDGPEDMSVWERAITNNLTNAYMLAGYAAETMRANNAGSPDTARMVFISSLAFNRGSWEHVPYACAKGGLVGLVRALSRRYAPDILVNGLAPGIIDTPMPARIIASRGQRLLDEIPLKRVGRPEEVAGVIAFLLGDDASYITGQIINIDGGIING
ncbi:MAG: SDR family oxidoreductase [Pseudomonadota bacterium]